MASINTYDEYGIPGSGNASVASGGRFAYTGQAWIPELGMYYYKARIYSPTLGRFLQTDPIGYKDQINLYAYVGNDPVNNVDPTGMCGSNIKGQASASCFVASNIQFTERSDFQRSRDRRPSAAAGPLTAEIAASQRRIENQIAILEPGFKTVTAHNQIPTIQGVRNLVEMRKIRLERLYKTALVNDRNGLTRVGRSFQKHRDRGEFSDVSLSSKQAANYNREGSEILRSIMFNPGSAITQTNSGNVVISTNYGKAVFTNGSFNYIAE